MKRIVLLISFLAVVALCANAQKIYIDFHEMHWIASPSPMPDNYPGEANLYWDNFLYVSPGVWSGAGPGFRVDPATQHNNVAFIGGPYCNLAAACGGSIKLEAMGMTPSHPGFQPISIVLSAGWLPNKVVVTAYRDADFVGTTEWNLTTTPKLFKFPPEWREVTQVAFTPRFIPSSSIYPTAGSMVVYNLLLVKH